MEKLRKMTIETFDQKETYALGQRLGEKARPGMIVTLDGDLGAGKTLFAQGVAAGLGITEPVNSPTFTILQEYTDGRMPMYHFDVYRIEEPEEMDEIGYEDCFFGEGISLVEWADMIDELIPAEAVRICLERVPEKGDNYRKITIEGMEEI